MASQASTGATTVVSGGPQNGGFRQKISDFGTFMFNSEEGTVLGRTAKSWGQIGFFYMIYYACLAGFFAAMITAFYSFIDEKEPRLIGTDSLIRQNPGLGYRPVPDIKTTLIHYTEGEESTYKKYVDDLDSFLAHYENQDDAVDCGSIHGRRPEGQWDKACKFDIASELGQCNSANKYGYPEGKPCILIKLNRIYDWQPQNYPDNASIPDAIRSMYEPYHVTLKCDGENPADVDNIGSVTYYPSGGFHYKYFPYRNQDGYVQPVVMAKLWGVKKGLALMVECKAYAYNIEHERLKKMGTVHFELEIDQN